MRRARRERVAVVGAGRLARALAGAVATSKGAVVDTICARRLGPARALARSLPGAVRATTDPHVAAARAEIVLLAVPDREIAGLARALATGRGIPWRERIVLHHAGALGVEPLAPLARRGARCGVLHPLQSFGRATVAERPHRGSGARVEGHPAARAAARRLARHMGLVVLPVRPSRRGLYHAAASVVANDLVALLLIGIDALARTGLGERRARAALVALARGVLDHAAAGGLAAAFTGPVSRDDADVLARQLAALAAHAPADAEIHRLLSARLARSAEALGATRPHRVRRLLARRRAVGPSRGSTL
jgi:predicted short-subunit dehydrogenase-like oxidoreductase (DUF2520 family)